MDSDLDLRLPEPLASIPRVSLLLGPSPIQHLPRLSAALSPSVQIYAKREDCNSGLAYGGNKTRKLEYLAADALAQGCDTLVSIGGIQSNHTRQVAAVAAKLGLAASTLQEHWVDWPDAGYDLVGNIQLSRLMAADVKVAPPGLTFGIEHKASLARLVQRLEDEGHRPYSIPAGASDHPLGGLGFARWVFELEAQERRLGLFFKTVVVCAVTGSTMAGMLAGFALARKELDSPRRHVIGIDASGAPRQTRDQVLRIARFTAVKIGLSEQDIDQDDLVLLDEYNAGVYGIPDQSTIDAIRFGASTEAFITDPVYEGKTLAGLMDLVKKGKIESGNVLFAHLGGQLALNAYSSI
ncbi:hypothetical protein CDD81_5349 [Ophiocordyceps australis]|uniref:Tryptophan synthase beta chain-like PALP domain-containing protein n=1 Tax=Ophiocordyceps australis TaxID=1399860 RepID=A0A2C5YAJ8_9HYPO|nr:hypothetical protein CDD81_5349 [Ophiocordyceps australis]